MASLWRTVILLGSIVTLAALTLLSALAFGFFVIPFVAAAGVCALFYGALRHLRVGNPMFDPHVGTRDVWADGQPLLRSMERAEQVRLVEEQEEQYRQAVEARLDRYARERAEAAPRTKRTDFEGPPPIVPFP